MRRFSAFAASFALAVSLVAAGMLATAPRASAATIAPTTTCSNGVDNTPGLGLICEVTVVNTITAIGGSAVVTVRECHGAAGDPEAACTEVTENLTSPVTAVTQCNDSTNGGGGTLRCSVMVTFNFVGVSPGSSAATVNQCVGSGDGITTGCDPFPATTTGATITQCNDSANGGTLVELTCTATGDTSSANPVLINQCNDSTNGGGGLVICSAELVIDSVAASPTPAPSAPTIAPSSPTSPPRVTIPPTDTIAARGGTSADGNAVATIVALLTVAFALLFAARRRGVSSRQR
ncbi:MAG: hypothetical protein H0U52_13580 [Chloroflexi bacterium]|nr:hypothetical protein [Chloroflexota bacterium]